MSEEDVCDGQIKGNGSSDFLLDKIIQWTDGCKTIGGGVGGGMCQMRDERRPNVLGVAYNDSNFVVETR